MSAYYLASDAAIPLQGWVRQQVALMETCPECKQPSLIWHSARKTARCTRIGCPYDGPMTRAKYDKRFRKKR